MSQTYPWEDSNTVTMDALDCFIGKQIGRGMSRIVYEHRTDPTLVIKVEHQAGSFQNIIEMEIWSEVKDTKWAKWFAPVVFISANGSVILQKKCESILDKKKYPERVPAFFNDLKYTNFGLLGKQFVCFDYGNIFVSNGIGNKMKKAKWWEESVM